MQAGDRHTLLCHKMPCLRTPPEWAGGLHASEPTPATPRDLLFSSCFSFPFGIFQHSLFLVPFTLCSMRAGAALARALCCCSSLVTVTAGTLSEKTYHISLGECHALR